MEKKKPQFDISNEQAIKETRKFAWEIAKIGDYGHSFGHAPAFQVNRLLKAGYAAGGLMRVGRFGDTEVFTYVTVSMPILVNGSGDIKELEIKETIKKGKGT